MKSKSDDTEFLICDKANEVIFNHFFLDIKQS